MSPSFEFSSDTCLSGGGAHFRDDWLYVTWRVDEPLYMQSHINILELLMTLCAIKRWGHLWAGSHVLIRTDNVATMSALNKGTSRGQELMPIIHEIFWLSVKFHFVVSSVFLPGELNVLADRISRLNECVCASDARLLLVGGVEKQLVYCEGHMSYDAFNYLQEVWTPGSVNS